MVFKRPAYFIMLILVLAAAAYHAAQWAPSYQKVKRAQKEALPKIKKLVREWPKSSRQDSYPDLSRFSFEQLKDCCNNARICGTSNGIKIASELFRRIPKMSSEQLVSCFDTKICGIGDDEVSGWAISAEMAQRGYNNELMVRYWKERNRSIRAGIEHVAYRFDNPEVELFMRKILAERVDDGENRFYPVAYLARKCDPVALKELSSGRYPAWGINVDVKYQLNRAVFGKCQYRPAIPYLVDRAIYDASLNRLGAAVDSLQALYPDSPTQFDSGEDMQRYFCGRARQEGFRVRCESY
jgi:hypothetical protein